MWASIGSFSMLNTWPLTFRLYKCRSLHSKAHLQCHWCVYPEATSCTASAYWISGRPEFWCRRSRQQMKSGLLLQPVSIHRSAFAALGHDGLVVTVASNGNTLRLPTTAHCHCDDLDAMITGPVDPATTMGLCEDFQQPEMQEALETVYARVRAARTPFENGRAADNPMERIKRGAGLVAMDSPLRRP